MPSPIDLIFKDIYGYSPDKPGTAFEKLASIATSLLYEGDVIHDDKLRGQFSKTLYQLDVHANSDTGSVMGEVKDYSIQDKKVGRGDLQKLGGALPDLKKIDSGAFFSVTEYTLPAKKYAQSAEQMIGKPITLWQLRPGIEADEEGFVKTVIIKMHIVDPQPERGTWKPHYTESGKKLLREMADSGKYGDSYHTDLRCFYNQSGEEILTLFDLTSRGYGVIHSETNSSHGSFLLHEHYINIDGYLIETKGLEYTIPHESYTQEIRITDDSGHRFVLVDSNGDVKKFLTDDVLRQFSFTADGKLTKNSYNSPSIK